MSKKHSKSDILANEIEASAMREEDALEKETGRLAPLIVEKINLSPEIAPLEVEKVSSATGQYKENENMAKKNKSRSGKNDGATKQKKLAPIVVEKKQSDGISLNRSDEDTPIDIETIPTVKVDSPVEEVEATAVAASENDNYTGREGSRPSADHIDEETGYDPMLGLDPEAAKGVDATILTGTPFIDNYYNETYCYIVPRDPNNAMVIWEVGEAKRKELLQKFGKDFFSNNRLIMRVYRVTGIEFNGFNAHDMFEVDNHLDDKVEYWISVQPDNNYIVELGYRANGTEFFEAVARSNSIFMPKGYPTDCERHNRGASVNVDPNNVELEVGPDDWRINQYQYWKHRTHAAPEEKGYWALVLHQHLPWIKHPEYDVPLEEQWFCEAVVSVYTQLINMFWRLEKDKVDFRLTVSLTPPLLSMMQDPLLQKRVSRHIDECINLATSERDNSHGQPYHDAVEHTLHKFWIAKEVWDAYEGDLTRAYRDFQDMGKLEVITCPATHMLLPLYMHLPEVINAQLKTAVKQYTRVFGRAPRGIWLPENAYTPGVDKFLIENGIKWCMLDSTAIKEADTKSHHGTNAPVITPAGLACFGIDEETRAQVWSREGGYPGHVNYKEWYRDLGYDADWDYLPKYWKTANVRRNTGLKYYRITSEDGGLGDKDYYNPLWAEGTVHEQAGQFVYYRGVKANHVRQHNGMKACTVSAYDAELFGHWWEEGPAWIESVFRKMLFDQQEVRPVTPSEYLGEHPNHQQLQPGASSWGKKNYFQVWVDNREYQPNSWVYRHYYRLCGKLIELATIHIDTEDELIKRALNQAARCFFLAAASDWGFLIETGQAVRYSEQQIVTHIDRIKELLRQVENNNINEIYLRTLETADSIFAWDDMDYRVFCRG